MVTPDVAVFKLCSSNTDVGVGAAIYELLLASREEVRTANDTAKGPEVTMNQGELRGINALIELFETGREVVKRAGGHEAMKHLIEGGSADI